MFIQGIDMFCFRPEAVGGWGNPRKVGSGKGMLCSELSLSL